MMDDKFKIQASIVSKYLGEPLLCFAGGRQHVDPKLGILRFGPNSYEPKTRHPASIKIGFIGTAETIETTTNWLINVSQGVNGDSKHTEFPGFSNNRGFYSDLLLDDGWHAQINHNEFQNILKIRRIRDRFEETLSLMEQKLRLLSSKDRPPDYIVISLPDDLIRKCRVAEYRDNILGDVHRDFRRAFKAIAMKYRIPTQLILQETVDGRSKDHPSKIAWNFFTGLYYKAGGYPWSPVGLTPGTCYIGVSFYRHLGSRISTMQTSLVQAFDEHGEGLVLRGQDFVWDYEKEGTKSPHLTEENAYNLVNLIISKYTQELGQTPTRVVIHKSSRFWPDEKNGFISGLKERVNKYNLVAVMPQSTVRLLTTYQYPPLRSTNFRVGEIDYLYTTGFIAELNQFHGLHVPSPLQIADHIGYDISREIILREILILTKLNWNSSRLGGLMPITLRFSRLSGDVMREIPIDREPLTNFKYYI